MRVPRFILTSPPLLRLTTRQFEAASPLPHGDAAMSHIPSAYDHDVIIVGASFAGAACALAAAQYGLRVCVLERKADPGERLHTTGIVVKEAMEQTW